MVYRLFGPKNPQNTYCIVALTPVIELTNRQTVNKREINKNNGVSKHKLSKRCKRKLHPQKQKVLNSELYSILIALPLKVH